MLLLFLWEKKEGDNQPTLLGLFLGFYQIFDSLCTWWSLYTFKTLPIPSSFILRCKSLILFWLLLVKCQQKRLVFFFLHNNGFCYCWYDSERELHNQIHLHTLLSLHISHLTNHFSFQRCLRGIHPHHWGSYERPYEKVLEWYLVWVCMEDLVTGLSITWDSQDPNMGDTNIRRRLSLFTCKT